MTKASWAGARRAGAIAKGYIETGGTRLPDHAALVRRSVEPYLLADSVIPANGVLVAPANQGPKAV